MFDLLVVQGTLKTLLHHHGWKASVLQCSAFFIVQLSYPYMTTEKTIALTIWIFISKVISLLFKMLSRFVIAFLPRSKHLSGFNVVLSKGFPRWYRGKESACQCRRHRRLGFHPQSGGSSGEENGNPFQCFYLEKPMDRGAWRPAVHGVAKSQTRLSN